MKKRPHMPPNKPEEVKKDLRNPEFESEINKYKHFIDGYKQATKETTEEYIKVFSLNWTARNDFAKIIITVSSAILALTVTFASNTLFKIFPPNKLIYIYSEWGLLLITLLTSIASLGLYIVVTTARILFIKQQPEFIKKVEEMISHGRFEKEFFDGLMFAPFDKVYKYDRYSGYCLKASVISFVFSLMLDIYFCIKPDCFYES